MNKNDEKVAPLPPVLTLPRVADIIGVSRGQVRRLVREGKLEARRAEVNGKLYFDTATVLRAVGWGDAES